MNQMHYQGYEIIVEVHFYLILVMWNCLNIGLFSPQPDGVTPNASDTLSAELRQAKKEWIHGVSINGNLPGWDLQLIGNY